MPHDMPVPEDENPGPGAYRPEGTFARAELHSAPHQTQSFGSRQPRIGWENDMESPFGEQQRYSTPGPGTYGDSRHMGGMGGGVDRNDLLEEPIGFNGTEERPCMRHGGRGGSDLPGPGEYDDGNGVLSIAGSLQRQVVSRRGVFGTTSRRFRHRGDFVQKLLEPGPGSYRPPPPEVYETNTERVAGTNGRPKRRPKNLSSGFKSTSQRFRTKDRGLQNAITIVGSETKPGPGAYEMRRPLRNQTEHSHVHVSFGSTATRDDGNTPLYGRATPGPGKYNGSPSRIGSTAERTRAAQSRRGESRGGESRGGARGGGRGGGGGGQQFRMDGANTDFSSSHFGFGSVGRVRPRRQKRYIGNGSLEVRFKSGVNGIASSRAANNVGPGSYSAQSSFVKKSFNISMR